MDPLVRMKMREQWFWCPEYATRTNLEVCQERVRRKRPYSPCNTCTRWSRKLQAEGAPGRPFPPVAKTG